MGACQLRVRPAGIRGAFGAPVSHLAVPDCVPDLEQQVQQQDSGAIPACPTRARCHRDARLGHAAGRLGKLLPAAAHGWCAAVYPVVFQQCGRRVAYNAGSETECDPYSMTGGRRETTSRGDVTRRRGGTA